MLHGQANDEETKTLHQMVLSNKDLMALFMKAQEYWHKSSDLQAFENIDLEEDWKVILEKISSDIPETKQSHAIIRRNFPYMKFTRYAASLLILVAFSVFALLQLYKPADSVTMYTTIEAPIGSRSKIELPDGSKVWLNAGSSITYANDFNINSRSLKLDGEAFFDVEKHDIPFLVQALDINLRVLGTSFNVRAYEDDAVIETTLVSGSLVIEDAPGVPSRIGEIVLEPNQKATFFRDKGSVTLTEQDQEDTPDIRLADVPEPVRAISRVEVLRKRDISPEVSWKDGMIVVEGEPLSELARRLERRYDVCITFENEQLKDYRYTGKLKELTLEQVLHAMKLTSPIDYSIEDQTVVIRENPLTRSKYLRYLN